MIHSFKSPYLYALEVIKPWESTVIGVYYCGFLNANGNLVPLYIGKGTGEEGIRVRLLAHLDQDYWPDVTHFGFHVCDYSQEAEQHEAEEIQKYKPKYNKIGK